MMTSQVWLVTHVLFLTDFETEEPIFSANIEFHAEDYEGHDYEYFTESDENGWDSIWGEYKKFRC